MDGHIALLRLLFIIIIIIVLLFFISTLFVWVVKDNVQNGPGQAINDDGTARLWLRL